MSSPWVAGGETGRAVMHDAAARRWLLFSRPVEVLQASRLAEVEPILLAVDRELGRGRLWAAGLVSYEAAAAFDPALRTRPDDGFPLAWFGLYEEPQAVPPPRPRGDFPDLAWEPSVGPEAYEAAFREVKRRIAAGDTYQVNYSFRFRRPLDFDPWEFFARMIQAQAPGYGAYLEIPGRVIASASPELFFLLEGERLSSRPMKGTAPRGLGSADDLRRAASLRRSVKNRAENVMIVDMVRNDLGRIAATGSVRVTDLFKLERYHTLWQMTTTVRGETREGLAGIFGALFPPASVTGAPKARTMEIIAGLEDSPRGIYTGSIGFAGPGRRAQFNVAIRTMSGDRLRGAAEYGVGGGIVWASRAAAELDECRLKARILARPRPEFSLLETILWTPAEGFHLLERHLSRLGASARYFSYRLHAGELRRGLASLAASLTPVPHKVRLLVPSAGPPSFEASPLEPLRAPWRVRPALAPVDSGDAFLYHKTTRRGPYERALEGCAGHDDVLLWNERGELTESSLANLVVEMDGEFVTPPVRAGLLPGVGRSLLLEQGRIRERPVRLEDLPNCSRVFLVNSVRGMWPAEVAGGGG